MYKILSYMCVFITPNLGRNEVSTLILFVYTCRNNSASDIYNIAYVPNKPQFIKDSVQIMFTDAVTNCICIQKQPISV